MAQAAVFIDGGYLAKILKKHFNEPPLDYAEFADWAVAGYQRFRAYYYDCLPYQGTRPTAEEREKLSARQRFFHALDRLDRFTVRQGRLEYRGTDDRGNPLFVQKRVDLQLGLDVASLVARDRVEMVALVTGDSDLIPAVTMAKNQAVLVRLVHGPLRTYSQDLWDDVDERREITSEAVGQLLRTQDKK